MSAATAESSDRLNVVGSVVNANQCRACQLAAYLAGIRQSTELLDFIGEQFTGTSDIISLEGSPAGFGSNPTVTVSYADNAEIVLAIREAIALIRAALDQGVRLRTNGGSTSLVPRPPDPNCCQTLAQNGGRPPCARRFNGNGPPLE